MKSGLWVWPGDAQGQRSVARKVMASEHIMSALNAIAKSKAGLSNAEVDDAISDSSEWLTIWVLRQLLSLGFIEYKVDFFGGPGHYTLTERGRGVFTRLTGQTIAAVPVVAAPAPAPPPTTQPSTIPKPISPVSPQAPQKAPSNA